jgi:prefoldin subunit 4
MKAKQNLLQNLSDAADEVMVNCEESDLVPYAFGEVFIHCSQDETLALLDKDKDKLQKEIDGMKGEVETLAERMSELKTYLYAKFGDNINLEADPDDD